MRYRAKPVEIDAVQWTGENREEVMEFVGNRGNIYDSSLIVRSLGMGTILAIPGNYIVKVEGGFQVEPAFFFESRFEEVK